MIIVYSKDNCPYCQKAEALLKMKGAEFSVNKLGVDFELEELKELFPQARTFPQITEVGKGYIGGYEELEKHFATQGLSL